MLLDFWGNQTLVFINFLKKSYIFKNFYTCISKVFSAYRFHSIITYVGCNSSLNLREITTVVYCPSPEYLWNAIWRNPFYRRRSWTLDLCLLNSNWRVTIRQSDTVFTISTRGPWHSYLLQSIWQCNCQYLFQRPTDGSVAIADGIWTQPSVYEENVLRYE